MNIKEAIEFALSGHAVAFLGAGFSRGCSNLAGNRLKTAKELAGYLAGAVELPHDSPLELAAEEYAHEKSEAALVQRLTAEFTVQAVEDVQKTILSIPWLRVYTTNWDNVAQVAGRSAGREFATATLSDRIRNTSLDAPLIVHFNGSVMRLDSESLWSEFKLTDASYAADDLTDSPWMALFRQDVIRAHAVFFLGYSLFDLDIRRVLHQEELLRDKTFFVVGEDPHALTKTRVRRYGINTGLGTEAFAREVEQVSAGFVPPEEVPFVGLSVEPYDVPPGSTITDEDSLQLWVAGGCEAALVRASIDQGVPYFRERLGTQSFLDHIRRDGAVLIESGLGNGKSMIVEGLKVRAAEAGYEVYTFTEPGHGIEDELDWIINRSATKLLVADDYPQWLDAIQYVSERDPKRSHFLLTARTLVHDIYADDLCVALGKPAVTEANADRLDDADIEWVVDTLDAYGWWGDKAGWTRGRKRRFLDNDCQREFSSILLMVFEAPQIVHRLNDWLETINLQKQDAEVLFVVLALTVLGVRLRKSHLVDYCGTSYLQRGGVRRNKRLREMIGVHGDRVQFRSAVAAQFILRRVADARVVIDTLIRLCRRASRLSDASPFHFNVYKSVTRYGSLQLLLPEKAKLAGAIHFYENTKNLPHSRRNPHFWLQYGIACRTLKDLERARRYIETAYGLAARMQGFRPHYIDNHFARLLFDEAVECSDARIAMEKVREARKILEKQLDDPEQRLQYPFRVAKGYAEVYRHFRDELSNEDKQQLRAAAVYVMARVEELPSWRRDQPSIRYCADEMSSLLGRIPG